MVLKERGGARPPIWGGVDARQFSLIDNNLVTVCISYIEEALKRILRRGKSKHLPQGVTAKHALNII